MYFAQKAHPTLTIRNHFITLGHMALLLYLNSSPFQMLGVRCIKHLSRTNF